jgi:hypothetical protein
MPPEPDRETDYEVGYRKPPRQTRFRPGVSGNPHGRPKGAKNLATLVHEALNEPVFVTENGQRRKLTKREALIKQLVNRSAQGDLKALHLLLGIMQDIERRREPNSIEPAFDAGDEKVFAQLKARLLGNGSDLR